MERMTDLHNELGDIKQSLRKLHQNPNKTEIGTCRKFVYLRLYEVIIDLTLSNYSTQN